jgi:hypothetical protein
MGLYLKKIMRFKKSIFSLFFIIQGCSGSVSQPEPEWKVPTEISETKAKPPASVASKALSKGNENPNVSVLAKPNSVNQSPVSEPLILDSWPLEGFVSPGYNVFKDELMLAILQARQRVGVITEELIDGDIATALYRAKLKGVKVFVVLSAAKAKKIESRGSYLSRAGITTIVFPIKQNSVGIQVFGSPTTLAIDNRALKVSVPLDERLVSSVRIDSSPFTPDEIFMLETAAGAKRFSEIPYVFQTKEKLKRKTSSSSSKFSLPKNQKARRLPKETILQKQTRDGGARSNDSSGLDKIPTQLPSAPEGESELFE